MKLDNVATVVMMICGVALFIAALVVLKILVSKKRSLTPVYGLFAFAMVMIGFSMIGTAKLPGFEFSKTVGDFAKDPTNPEKIAAASRDVDELLAKGKGKELSPETKADVEKAVTSLSRQTNLSSEAHAVLAKSFLVLGRTNDAKASAATAVRINPRMTTDRRLRALTAPPP